MKSLQLPKNKFARVAINAAFIAIWEEITSLIIEIFWERLIFNTCYRNFIFDTTYFVFHLLDMVG